MTAQTHLILHHSALPKMLDQSSITPAKTGQREQRQSVHADSKWGVPARGQRRGDFIRVNNPYMNKLVETSRAHPKATAKGKANDPMQALAAK